ncbi:MAG: tetratricopeptide repeat protein [Spirochaetaceae bacterium]
MRGVGANRTVLPLLVALLFLLPPSLSAQRIDMDEAEAEQEFRWGVVAFHQGNFNEAILSFTRSLALSPETPRPRFWLGLAYYRSGFHGAALGEWEKLVEAGEETTYLRNLIDNLRYRRSLEGGPGELGAFVHADTYPALQNEVELFLRPITIRPRPDGSYYLTSFATHEILVINQNGRILRSLQGGLAAFDQPFDVLSLGEYLYVSEFGSDRIARCRPDGIKVDTFGSSGVEEGQLLGPQYLTGDEEGFLYVSDWGNRRVSKFSREGEFVLSFGPSVGSFDGLARPTGIAYSDESIIVADRDPEGARLVRFDLSGNFLQEITGLPLEAPESLRALPEGRLLVADGGAIHLLDLRNERLIQTLQDGIDARVTSADLDPNGNIVAVDFDENALLLYAEERSLYSGMQVQIDYIRSEEFPRVTMQVTVTDREGNPIVGLGGENFILTEQSQLQENAELLLSGHETTRVDGALLFAPTREVTDFASEIAEGVEQLFANGEELNFRSVVAESQPTVADPAGSGVTTLTERARSLREENDWQFDQALRLAASDLVGTSPRRSIIFFSPRALPDNSFANYGLQELADYMSSNHIRFHAVQLERGAVPEEVTYLAEATGGSVRYLLAPEGLGPLIQEEERRAQGSYILRYESDAETDFGRAYIPVDVEASLLIRSGRGESGYFAPLQF